MNYTNYMALFCKLVKNYINYINYINFMVIFLPLQNYTNHMNYIAIFRKLDTRRVEVKVTDITHITYITWLPKPRIYKLHKLHKLHGYFYFWLITFYTIIKNSIIIFLQINSCISHKLHISHYDFFSVEICKSQYHITHTNYILSFCCHKASLICEFLPYLGITSNASFSTF